MIVLKILGIVAAVAGAILFAWVLSAMASKLEREEERARVLKPCPVCRRIPHLGYCCGEYFIFGENPDCPGCGTAFTEMHSSPELEIEAWNRRATRLPPAADTRRGASGSGRQEREPASAGDGTAGYRNRRANDADNGNWS